MTALTTSEAAPIGDELRIPVLACGMGQCIERFSHPQAAGEVANMMLAAEAGWRTACPSGARCSCRWACPRCQKTSPEWRPSDPPRLFDPVAAAENATQALPALHAAAIRQGMPDVEESPFFVAVADMPGRHRAPRFAWLGRKADAAEEDVTGEFTEPRRRRLWQRGRDAA